jgi:hypothetical protein
MLMLNANANADANANAKMPRNANAANACSNAFLRPRKTRNGRTLKARARRVDCCGESKGGAVANFKGKIHTPYERLLPPPPPPLPLLPLLLCCCCNLASASSYRCSAAAVHTGTTNGPPRMWRRGARPSAVPSNAHGRRSHDDAVCSLTMAPTVMSPRRRQRRRRWRRLRWRRQQRWRR